MQSRYLVVIGIIIIFLLGIFLFTKQHSISLDVNKNNTDFIQYSNITYGISFLYPLTYIIGEMDIKEDGGQIHHQITLTRKEDLPLPVSGEGPPTITIDFYQNSANKYTTEEWIRNSKESNFKLGEGIIATTTVSNIPALSFRWSGLYEGTTIAIAKSDWVYVFTVTYLEMGAPIVQDFVKIRDSVKISN